MSVLIDYNSDLRCRIIHVLGIHNRSLESLNPSINYFVIYAGRLHINNCILKVFKVEICGRFKKKKKKNLNLSSHVHGSSAVQGLACLPDMIDHYSSHNNYYMLKQPSTKTRPIFIRLETV
jgi:hypothetical protein